MFRLPSCDAHITLSSAFYAYLYVIVTLYLSSYS